MIRVIAIVATLLAFISLGELSAQSLSFDKKSINFGTIKEQDGKVTDSFTITNTSNKPFIINYITTGCGCTAAKFDKSPLRPKQSRTIEITFDPKWRSGLFRTDVHIVAASPQERYEVGVIGNIIPSKESILDMFPFAFGNQIRLSSSRISFGAIASDSLHTSFVTLINNSDKSITIEAKSSMSGSKAWIEKPNLKPNEKSYLMYEFNASGIGEIKDMISLSVDGRPIAKKVEVSAIVTEPFHKWSDKQIESAAELHLNKNIHQMGKIDPNKASSYSFEVTNLGEDDLKIEQFVRVDKALTVTKNFDSLGKGESGKITLTLDPKLFEEEINARVTIVTNSPYAPVKTLTIIASK